MRPLNCRAFTYRPYFDTIVDFRCKNPTSLVIKVIGSMRVDRIFLARIQDSRKDNTNGKIQTTTAFIWNQGGGQRATISAA